MVSSCRALLAMFMLLGSACSVLPDVYLVGYDLGGRAGGGGGGNNIPTVVKYAARSTAAQSNGSIPSSSTLTAYVPQYIPSDVTTAWVEMSNSYVSFPTSANYGDLVGIDVGIYAGNGSGAPTGSVLHSWLGNTIPELASAPWVSSTFDPTSARDAQGFMMVLIGIPAGMHVGYTSLQGWGQYTTINQITPLPGSWTGFAPVVMSLRTHYETARPRVVVRGDSLSVGYSPAFDVGKGKSGFFLPGVVHDWSIDIEGTPGATLDNWNSPLLRPYFPVGNLLSGTTVMVELGVNDLNSLSTLSDYQSLVTTQLGLLSAAGASKVTWCTLPPGVSWVGKNTLRNSINAWLITVPSGISAVADVSATVADPGTPSQLLPAYDAGDGDHWNVAGHSAVAPVVAAALSSVM